MFCLFFLNCNHKTIPQGILCAICSLVTSFKHLGKKCQYRTDFLREVGAHQLNL